MQFEIKTLGAKLTHFQESWREQYAPLTAENETEKHVLSDVTRRLLISVEFCVIFYYLVLENVLSEDDFAKRGVLRCYGSFC